MTPRSIEATPKPLIDQIRELTTPAKALLMGLYEALSDAILIPNSYLPESRHGKEYANEGVRRHGRSVTELMRPPKISKAEQTRLENEERQLEKSLRIESYENDQANGRPITYHPDEERLYRNQMTFANLIGLEFGE